MNPSFETNVTSIGEIFSGNNAYQLPLFQRSFAWQEEQAAQLLDDLMSAFERVRDGQSGNGSGGYYFLGPIILARSSLNGPFELVDGQQRLITISMILATLRDLLPTNAFQSALQMRLTRPGDVIASVHEASRIQVQEVNRTEYEQRIHQLGGTLRSVSIDNRGAVFDGVLDRIREDLGTPRTGYVEALARFILEDTFVIRMQAAALGDAYMLFRSVNTPGMPLSGLDLVRGELLGSEHTNNRNAARLADAWDKIESGLGSDKLESYVDTVLTLVSPGYDGKDLKLGLRDILPDARRTTEFRASLANFIRSYTALDDATLDIGSEQDNAAINRVVACFQGVPFDQWRPSALLWLTRTATARETLSFFRALNGLCLGFMVMGTASGRRRKRFDQINARIKEGSILSGATSELFLSPKERSDIHTRLAGAIPARAKYIKALLLRLNAEMQDDVIPPFFPENLTLEHVLPQKPSPKSQWAADFPDQRKRKQLCLNIGNLTILTPAANSSIRNSDFETKKSEIFGVNGNQSFALNQHICRKTNWTETEILERQQELLHLANQCFSP